MLETIWFFNEDDAGEWISARRDRIKSISFEPLNQFEQTKDMWAYRVVYRQATKQE